MEKSRELPDKVQSRSIVRRLYDLCAKTIRIPTVAERNQFYRDWDRGQMNRREIWDAEPDRDSLRDASALFEHDQVLGFQRYVSLAEGGSVTAMEWLAFCYSDGKGVTADPALAEQWHKRAFEAGSDMALLNYASDLCRRGDFDGADAVYGVGVARGWAPAMYWLAMRRERRSKSRKTYLKTRPLLERAAALGSPAARNALARNLGQGRYGFRHVLKGQRLLFEMAGDQLAAIELRQERKSKR